MTKKEGRRNRAGQVEALNHIRRIYDFTNLGRIFIEDAQNFPIILPAFHAGGVLLSPFLREPKQVFSSSSSVTEV